MKAVEDEVASSFRNSKVNSTRMPTSAIEPATGVVVMVETVEVVTVEIMMRYLAILVVLFCTLHLLTNRYRTQINVLSNIN